MRGGGPGGVGVGTGRRFPGRTEPLDAGRRVPGCPAVAAGSLASGFLEGTFHGQSSGVSVFTTHPTTKDRSLRGRETLKTENRATHKEENVCLRSLPPGRGGGRRGGHRVAEAGVRRH